MAVAIIFSSTQSIAGMFAAKTQYKNELFDQTLHQKYEAAMLDVSDGAILDQKVQKARI